MKKATDPRPFLELRQELISTFEQGYLKRLLALTRGNVSEAARKAGISRQALYGRFRRRGIDREKFR